MRNLFISFLALSNWFSFSHATSLNENFLNRRYDQVVFATTHNSTSTTRPPHRTWFIPNQENGVRQQLSAGIRGFMIDAHLFKGKVWACHAYCELGKIRMDRVLRDIKNFLDENPKEIVTIIFESYVDNKILGQEFEKVQLDQLAFVPDLANGTMKWPTLSEMIQTNKRLVVFSDRNEPGPDWMLYVWKYSVETHFSVKKPSEFQCDFNRGAPENSLFILNHFVTRPLLRRAWARRSNKESNITDHFFRCLEKTGKIPNFLTIDFYLTSDIVSIVTDLNSSLHP